MTHIASAQGIDKTVADLMKTALSLKRQKMTNLAFSDHPDFFQSMTGKFTDLSKKRHFPRIEWKICKRH